MNDMTKQTLTPTNSSHDSKIPTSADAPKSAPTSVAKTPAARKSVSASAQASTKKTAAKLLAAKMPKTTPVANVSEAAATAPALKKPKESHAAAKAAHNVKVKKEKLVRDSFTMPESEYQALADAKKECLKAGIAIKKSELLRVSLASLKLLSVAQLTAARDGLTKVQAGRPKK